MRRNSSPGGVMLMVSLVASACTMNYTSWQEGSLEMHALARKHPEASVHVLGESSTPGIYQKAIKISLGGAEDDPERNSILFECGMHAREWYAAESCYSLIEYLLDNIETAAVRELLEHVDVWVIPQSNPAGRHIDDRHRGDPTRYTRYCTGGPDSGEACRDDADCAVHCYDAGWRGNANRDACQLGVDPARNFSRGWGKKTCTTSSRKYSGAAPFSERETLNLRRFVHNHMLSSVVIVHANAQQIWNQWRHRGSLAGSHQDQRLAEINKAGLVDLEVAMLEQGVGGGSGQFSAWLSRPSNTKHELDFKTERNISTFFLELPPGGKDADGNWRWDLYETGDYDGAPYQAQPDDGSNAFHPSGVVWRRLWTNSIRPLYLYLIRQARSPQCPVDDASSIVTASCRSADFGLVGAKIATEQTKQGSLLYHAASRREVLPAGAHKVVFAVQSYGTDSPPENSKATVRISKGGEVAQAEEVPLGLGTGDRRVYSVAHAFEAAHDYRVEILLDDDDFKLDNRKIFAFRVEEVLELPPWVLIPERWAYLRKLELPRIDKDRNRIVLEGELVTFGDWIEPGADLAVRLVRHSADLPRPVVTTFPVAVGDAPAGGSPRVVDSRIENIGARGRFTRYRLRLVLEAEGLAAVRKSSLLTVDLRLGEELRVLGSKTWRPGRLPPRNPPARDEAIEDEPNEEDQPGVL